MNYKNRAKRVTFNEAADWLIGVKFERGDKVTLECATPCLYRVRQNHLICLRAFANTRRAIVRPRTHLLNFSFAFIVSSFFLFQPPWMMIPLCVGGRRMCVNYFIVFAQALEEFPPFCFFGIKHFRYLGPIPHACALFITSCNITFRPAHHACLSQLPQLLCGAGV